MALAFISGYTLSNRTTVSKRPNIISSMAASGRMRFINIGAVDYYNIRAVITLLTEAEKETLVDWLVTNQTTEIALPINNETYNGYLDPVEGVYAALSTNSNHLWDVAFGFAGDKQ